MIAHLRGKLISKRPGQAIVEAAGVGYDVTISVPTFTALPAAGAEVALHVHTHVREDALALFGFIANEEKQLFERLISVSGVGPKLALTILSGMPSAAEIVGAIRAGDVARLTRIPGVGKKTAERLALELKDKLDAFAGVPARAAAGSPLEEDVLSALLNLGYQRPHAERAVAAAAAAAAANGGKAGAPAATFDALFRRALASLTK